MGFGDSPAVSLKNFQFLVPHLPKLEGDLQALLFEIDQLIEKKKENWTKDLKSLEAKLSRNAADDKLTQKITDESLHSFEEASNHPREHVKPESQSNSEGKEFRLKSAIEWMHWNYESMKAAYEKQILTVKDRSYKTLKKIEKDNRLLLAEIKNLKDTSRSKTEVLACQLSEEKNSNAHLQERCNELESRMNACVAELENERDLQRKLQLKMHSRQSELDNLLQKANRTVELQASELAHAKQVLATKQTEIAELSSALSSKNSALYASKDVIRRLEVAVFNHLSLLSIHKEPEISSMVPCSPGSSIHVPRDAEHFDGLDGKIIEMERNLLQAHHLMKVKIQEMRRLKSACAVASSTIRKLTEMKTSAVHQVTSVGESLRSMLDATKNINECIERFKKAMYIKLLRSEQRMRQLTPVIHEIRSRHVKWENISARCSVAVQKNIDDRVGLSVSLQTDTEYTAPPDYWPGPKVRLLRNDWLMSVQKLQKQIDILKAERSDLISQLKHQAARADELQKDNLALTDLLTDAEKFNRTRISCFTDIPDADECVSHVANLPSRQAPVLQPDLHQSPCKRHFPRILLRPSTGNPGPLPSSDSNLSPVHLINAVASTPKVSHTSPSDHPSVTDVQELERQGNIVPSALPDTPMKLDNGQSLDATAISLSPAEYGEFVLSTVRKHRATFPPNHYVTAQATKRLWDTDQPFDQTGLDSCVESSEEIRCLSSFSPPQSPGNQPSEKEKDHIRFKCDDEVRQVDENNSACIGSTDSAQSTRIPLPLPLTSPIIRNQSYLNSEAEEIDEDASVYCLTAKFLADEQQHSLRLEQQIDMHLEELKRQIGL